MTNNLVLSLGAILLVVNVVLSTPLLMKPPHLLVKDALNKARSPSDTCYTQTCAGVGASCDPTNTPIPLCVGGTYCGDGLKCAKVSAAGGTCDDDDECATGECDTIANVCVGNKTPGQACTDDHECMFYNSSGATFRKCMNSMCYGLGMNSACTSEPEDQCLPPYVCNTNLTCMASGVAGSSCVSNEQCAYNVYCSGGSCMNQLADGTICSPSASPCLPTSDCTPTDSSGINYKCMALYSQPVNSYCSDDSHCGEGLACNNTNSDVGMCFTGVKTSSMKSCAGDDDTTCPAGEACSCNSGSGKYQCYSTGYNPSGIKSDLANLFSCTEKNNCLYSNSLFDYTCANSKCQSQYCSYLQDGLNDFSYAFSSVPACFKNEIVNVFAMNIPYAYNCKLSLGGGASTIAASFSLIVFVALAILL